MKSLVFICALLFLGCSVTTAKQEAQDAAKVSRAALAEVKQIRVDVETLKVNVAKGQTTSRANQVNITKELREVSNRLDKLTAALETAGGFRVRSIPPGDDAGTIP